MTYLNNYLFFIFFIITSFLYHHYNPLLKNSQNCVVHTIFIFHINSDRIYYTENFT